jgi:hypothetical protein
MAWLSGNFLPTIEDISFQRLGSFGYFSGEDSRLRGCQNRGTGRNTETKKPSD